MFCTIFMAEVIVFIAWCIISSRKNKAAAEVDDTEIIDELHEKKKNKCVITVIKVLFCLLIILTGFVALLEKAIIHENWKTFDSERIAKIESSSGIKIDGHVKLKSYTEKFGGPDGPRHILKFECDIDMFEFAEKNCDGYIESYAKDGKFYCIDDEKEKTEGKKEFELFYEYDGKYGDKYDEYYVIRGKYHRFEIYKQGDTYVHEYPNWSQVYRDTAQSTT